MPEPLLETVGLSKFFGALGAVSDVSLLFEQGRIHAIIGPNGAGKTTLINLLAGQYRPTSGQVRFKGTDITGATPDRISQLGIGRCYQKTNIFPTFTCLQNCWLGAQSRLPSSMRFFRPAHRLGSVRARAQAALEACGLSDRTSVVAGTLSHGEQRQLELAIVLATEPKLLLLDEPLAGMGTEDSARMLDLLRLLARDHTLILIEHDMDAVFSIAEVLTVMVNGVVLETGTVEQIRNSAAVQEAYLGVEEE